MTRPERIALCALFGVFLILAGVGIVAAALILGS